MDENDQPISNAVVHLREWAVVRNHEMENARAIFSPRLNDTFATTKTDQLGEFYFHEVESPSTKLISQGANRWTIVAEIPGRPNAWFKLKEPKSDEPIRLVAKPGTTVEGVVHDSKGQPIPDVEVYVDEISQPNSRQYQLMDSLAQFVYRNSELSPRTTTDAKGRFSMPNIPTERRIGIAFVHRKYVPQIDYAGTTKQAQQPMQEQKIQQGKYVINSIPVQAGQMQIELVEGHRLTGRLVDNSNQGIASQAFDLRLTPSEETETLTTDADGRFETHRFRDPYVRLRVKLPNNERYVACEEDFQFEAREIERQVLFQLPIARTIHGTLTTEDSKPIHGAKIVFVPDGQTQIEGPLKSTTTVETDDSGEYEMRISAESGTLVAVGPVFGYELSTIDQIAKFQRGELNPRPKSWGRVDHSSFSKSSAHNEGKVAHVDLVGSRAQIVTGRVVNENGDPVRDTSIDVVDGLFEWNGPFQGMSRAQIQELFHTQSDGQGIFQISGLPRIPHIVFSIVDSTRSEVALIYLDQLTSYADVTVTLHKGIVMTGKVNLDGKPVPDATVFLNVIGDYEIREDGKSVQEQFHWGQVKTDKMGNYRFTGIPAKPQYVVSARIANDMNDSRNPKLDPAIQNIEVPDFEFKSLNAIIAGVVVDPSGKPVAGVEVSAVDAISGSSFPNNGIVSGADGSFQIDRLPDNTAVKIRASFRVQRVGTTTTHRLPAEIDVLSGDMNIRVVLDPRLSQEPRKIQSSNSEKFP